MAEVEIRFEREDREGIVATGTYLADAARRFGIHFEAPCEFQSGTHYCSLVVSSGSGLLSRETKAEAEYFKTEGQKAGERLACQVKIEKAGEVVIMTKEKEKQAPHTPPDEDANEQYRKEFAEMPLEKKIANLVQLETIALGETVSFIVNSPFKIADKLMDVMAEFGFRKEEKQKEAVRPEEHKASPKDRSGDQAKKAKHKKAPKPPEASV